ncbi:MAG: hypothetical protein JRF63_08285 [Deltaproteobacteria bacterium]|nr:hypothetical protein [Deltaproteobacteria bacterium]
MVTPTALASTVRGLTLSDLVVESDIVVRGRAVSKHAFRHPRLGIVSVLKVAVDARLVGDCEERIEVLLLGGELETSATDVPGEADIKVGDEALLFLSSAMDGSGRFRVVGMSQGAFAVMRQPGSAHAFATRDLGNLNLIGELGEDDLGLVRACTSTFIRLELLEALVIDLARSARI